MQTYLSFPSYDLGKSADNTAGMLERFDSDVLPFQPEFLIILGGGPSLIEGVPAAQVINEGWRQSAINVCSMGVRPVFLTIPTYKSANIKRTTIEIQ